ncbi:MAG: hypothetical protein OK442_01270 [Thaumarchaeota archaeon]|nr:hypothetical protein [Nitrososphaerota archaeon]
MAKRMPTRARDEKLENLIMNHSMIFMGMFEEAFSAIAEHMTEALSEGAGALADVLARGAKSGDGGVEKELKNEITPAVRAEIGNLFSGIREEMSSQWPKEAAAFKRYISSPTFDKGIEIVERYDFGRPKLTEKLSDEVLASYVFLLQSGDKEMGKMFKELAEWQAALPKPPWAS